MTRSAHQGKTRSEFGRVPVRRSGLCVHVGVRVGPVHEEVRGGARGSVAQPPGIAMLRCSWVLAYLCVLKYSGTLEVPTHLPEDLRAPVLLLDHLLQLLVQRRLCGSVPSGETVCAGWHATGAQSYHADGPEAPCNATAVTDAMPTHTVEPAKQSPWAKAVCVPRRFATVRVGTLWQQGFAARSIRMSRARCEVGPTGRQAAHRRRIRIGSRVIVRRDRR
jgi:hypothetical protein